MLKKKPANEYHQILPWFICKYEPKQNGTIFESAKEVLLETDLKNGCEKTF